MGDEDVKGFDAVQAGEDTPSKEAEVKQWVVWDHNWNFQSRGLTRTDLLSFGAEEDEDEPLQAIEWNEANRWRVPREQMPLTDLQLGQLLGTDSSFRLVDA